MSAPVTHVTCWPSLSSCTSPPSRGGHTRCEMPSARRARRIGRAAAVSDSPRGLKDLGLEPRHAFRDKQHIRMRPPIGIAAPLAVLVLVSSALGTVLDCGMHRPRNVQAAPGQKPAARGDGRTCHSTGSANGGGHHEGAPGSHDDEHHSGPTCCHTNLYNAVPRSISGLEVLRATSSAGHSQEFTVLILPSALSSPSTVRGDGAGPPGSSFPRSSRFLPGRQLFLAVSSLLL